MTDDSHGDELEDLDAALFGSSATPPPSDATPPSDSDLDWLTVSDSALPTPPPVPAGDDSIGDLFGDGDGDGDGDDGDDSAGDRFGDGDDGDDDVLFAPLAAVAASPAPSAPLSRRELHSHRSADDRRKRLLVLAGVIALVLVVGLGAVAVAGRGEGSEAKSQVKVVGTALPTTTPSTRPVTTAAPVTLAPTAPPATAAPVLNNANTTPVRTNPPVVATDPPPPPPPTAAPTTTTTTIKPGCPDPDNCVG
jgi:hypothetical protein